MAVTTLQDWVDSLPPRMTRILNAYLGGVSFRDIGRRERISGEYVRMLCRQTMLTPHRVPEDGYAALFSKYNWTKKTFCLLTGEPQRTYRYLFLAAPKGKDNLSLLATDPDAPDIVKKNYEDTLFVDGVLFHHGKPVGYRRKFFLADAVYRFAKEPVSVGDFSVLYKKYLEKSGYQDDIRNRKGFLARIWRSRHALCCFHEQFRYFDVDGFDIASFEKEIGLSSLGNMAFSTKLLFDRYPSVMKACDIRNEYELHSLLRLRSDDLSVPVTFHRMPMVSIGETSHAENIRDLLREMCGEPPHPVSKDAFVTEYCKRFGVNKRSFYAVFHQTMREHKFGGGTYLYKYDKLTEREIEFLQGILTEDVCFLEDFIGSFCAALGDRVALLNDEAYWKLGYRRCRTVFFKKEFPFMQQALDSYFMEPVRHMNRKMINQISVHAYLVGRAKRFTLFRYDEETFVNRRWLHEHGYTDKTIKDFICAVEQFAGDTTFSIDSLKHSGFSHEWLKNRKEYFLLSSFLQTSPQFHSRIRSTGEVLFHRHYEKPSVALAATEVARDENVTSYKRIASLLRERFKIPVKTYYLRRVLRYGIRDMSDIGV